MKAKNLSLLAGMALAANLGVSQAAEFETTGMPEIFGAVTTHEATLMTGNEMASTKGGYPSAPSGYYVYKVKYKKKGVKVVYRKDSGSGSLVYKSWKHSASHPSMWKYRSH